MKARTLGCRTFRLTASTATLILALTGGAAIAQPALGAGHGPGHPGGMAMEHVLMSVKGQLNLNTSQQLMWDNAVAQTKAAHAAGRANWGKVHDAMALELAKPEPDLAALAAAADSVQASSQTLRQSVRSQWLQLYATFSPEQKAVVRGALAAQMARMEAIGRQDAGAHAANQLKKDPPVAQCLIRAAAGRRHLLDRARGCALFLRTTGTVCVFG